MSERDSTRLRDILNEARLAQKFAHGKTLADLYSNDLLSHAIILAL